MLPVAMALLLLAPVTHTSTRARANATHASSSLSAQQAWQKSCPTAVPKLLSILQDVQAEQEQAVQEHTATERKDHADRKCMQLPVRSSPKSPLS
jgi:hypothetical protein